MSLDQPGHSDNHTVAEPRSQSVRRRVGVGVSALAVILVVAHVVWNITAPDVISDQLRDTDVFASNLPTLMFTVAGGLIIAKQPWNRIGWLLCLVGPIALLLVALPSDYAGVGLALAPGSVPAPEVPLSVQEVLPVAAFSSILCVLTALFPDGQLIRPWLRVIWLILAVHVAVVLPGLFDPKALDHFHVQSPLSLAALSGYSKALVPTIIGQGTFGAAFILAWGSMIWRYREAAQDERHQIKWLLAAVFLVFVAFIGWATGILPQKALPVVAATLPLSIGLAILRYRLYGIDAVISRTLVYGALAVFITAVYVGVAVGIGALVGSGGKPNLGLSILATAIVAMGFQPLRERLQRFANHLVYGERATPYEVLSRFSERVAESYASDDVLPRMARVLAEGTAAELAEVWLRSGDVLRRAGAFPLESPNPGPVHIEAAGSPTIPHADRTVVVRQQGDLLGVLTVTKRRAESLTPIEIKLMDDLARQAGLVLRNVGLTADLKARLDDLRASRQRLVAAQDNERRRLERNLHDGAQQHLVAIKVKLGLVEMLATRDPERAKATIVALKGDADEALATLRDLARGIYPPLLAHEGLAVALQSQAGRATLPVHVDADGVGRYPQETEAALYFCTLEALQNVQKYAVARAVAVRLRDDGKELLVEVADDGRGFDVTTAVRGAGLTNMEDRLDALGGMLRIESTPGVGTTLRATIPVSRVMPLATVSDRRETAASSREGQL